MSPIHRAIRKKDYRKLWDLLRFNPELANKADKEGVYPVHYAAARRDLKAIDMLLEWRCTDCLVQDELGRNLLYYMTVR